MSFYSTLPTTTDTQVSLSSLNVLADDYVNEDRKIDNHMTWAYRMASLHRHLAEVNSDVICLQEVQGRHFESDFLSHLRTLGYDGVMQDTNHIVGVATFFKTSKFSLAWSESRSRAMLVGLNMKVTVEDVADTAAVVTVPVMVGNVHLEGHHNETAKRFSQMKSLLKRCEARLGKVKPQDAMVFICGDFNSGVEGGAVRVLPEGELSPEVMEHGAQTTPTHFTHPFKFANAYPATGDLRHPTFVTDFLCSTIDHVFFPRDLVDTVGVLSIRQKDLEEVLRTLLPNVAFPSDHLPVGAVFKFTPKMLDFLRRKAAET